MRSERRSGPASRSSAAARRRTTRARKPTGPAASSSPATCSRATPWPSSCSPARWRSRSASRPAGAASVRGRRSPGSPTAGVLEIDGRPALEFYERFVGAGPPPVANPLAVFEEPGSDRFYLRTPVAYDRERGSIDVLRRRPGGRDRAAHDGGHRPDLRRHEGLDRRCPGPLPGGRPAGRRPPLLLRDSQVPAGDACRSGDRARARRPRAGDADRRPLLHGRDRADGRGGSARGSTTPRWSRSCSDPRRRTGRDPA